MTKLSKEDLARLQNPENWEGSDNAVQVPAKPPRAVVSVAFSREDFETIVEMAKQHGMKTSDFIRRAAIEKAAPKRSEALVASVSGGSIPSTPPFLPHARRLR